MISLIIVSPTDTPLERLCLDKLYTVFSLLSSSAFTEEKLEPHVINECAKLTPTWFTKSISCQKFLDQFIHVCSSFPSVISRGPKCSCVIFEKLFEVFSG